MQTIKNAFDTYAILRGHKVTSTRPFFNSFWIDFQSNGLLCLLYKSPVVRVYNIVLWVVTLLAAGSKQRYFFIHHVRTKIVLHRTRNK